MSETIAHRDLRNRSAEILRAVQDGQTYEITNHGVVVAVLSPLPEPPFGGLQVRPARRRHAFGDLPPPVSVEEASSDALDELRADR